MRCGKNCKRTQNEKIKTNTAVGMKNNLNPRKSRVRRRAPSDLVLSRAATIVSSKAAATIRAAAAGRVTTSTGSTAAATIRAAAAATTNRAAATGTATIRAAAAATIRAAVATTIRAADADKRSRRCRRCHRRDPRFRRCRRCCNSRRHLHRPRRCVRRCDHGRDLWQKCGDHCCNSRCRRRASPRNNFQLVRVLESSSAGNAQLNAGPDRTQNGLVKDLTQDRREPLRTRDSAVRIVECLDKVRALVHQVESLTVDRAPTLETWRRVVRDAHLRHEAELVKPKNRACRRQICSNRESAICANHGSQSNARIFRIRHIDTIDCK